MTAVLRALLDLIGFERARWTCEAIERLRPGHGHAYSDHCEPPACLWCGSSRPAIHSRRTVRRSTNERRLSVDR